ncbi:MAG TPA: arginine--tRNA ligase [Chloroflexota bacterium]|nr:arginine--tRNA ligase [Chloroflexota bacterium]
MNGIVVREEIGRLLRQAAEAAKQRGLLPQVALPEITVEPPQRAEHGDYATNLALRLARAARMAPPQIAQILIQSLPPNEVIARAEVAGAGFINIVLRPDWISDRVAGVLAAGDRYGASDQGQARRVQVEFVSANPTERLHAGSGRAAALGDSLANLLDLSGWRVQREYLVNDAGGRLQALGETVLARYLQALGHPAEVPQDGYQGAFLADLGRELAAEHGDSFMELGHDEAVAQLSRIAVERIVTLHKADMDALGVRFDAWFREQPLHDAGEVEKVIDLLRERGYVVEREGAVWFSSTTLGDDKDNVLIRSNGVPGYLAADIAYHYDKLVRRGFDRVIDVWGADHQGHVSRMKAAVQAIGVEPDRLTIIIHQLVTLREGGEVVKLSKRTGKIIALADVIEEVGRDACRFLFLARAPESQMEFDLDLARQQSLENPVYYVQYAHARTASILDLARQRGVDWAEGATAAPATLEHPAELALARLLLRYPEIVYDAAAQLQPHHLTHYALELGRSVSAFYRDCRVLPSERTPDDPPPAVSVARLRLVAATRQVLRNVLTLIGVSAPEHMERLEVEAAG